jgi:hypothetical protein
MKKLLILGLLILVSCQDTSVLEEGTVSVEESVDESILSTYDESNAPFGNYLNSGMTITEAVSTIEEKTIVNPLILSNSTVEVGDSVAGAIGKLQAQLNAGGGSGAMANYRLDSTNVPLYNNKGIFTDLENHTSGLKFESDGSIDLYSNETMAASFNENKLEVFSDLYVNGQIYTLSDKRSKNNIEELKNGLNILKINPVRFRWKKTNKKDFGLIAQNVKEHFPEAVSVDKSGLHRVNYAKLLVPLLEVVKKQQEQIDELKKTITKYQP